MADFSIRDILTKVAKGNIRIPTFQRGFVWEPEGVAFLMDSIYKGYPFGAIQLWRTREQLTGERTFGPFQLFEAEEDYPIDYVLDGQQRVTSIFGVFQTEIPLPEGADNPFSIYFDFQAPEDAQDTQFFALKPEEADLTRHFPLGCLFDPRQYREQTGVLAPATIAKIDRLQEIFKEAKIPYQTLETDDRAKVAIVFERINRTGIPLDTFQLFCAWTWSEEFALQRKFEDLTDELRPYGFEQVGANINLLLRVCAAVLTGNSTTAALLDVNGGTVRDRFEEIINGVRGAIDFLKNNFKTEKLDNLPYDTILIPLSVFFANSGNSHFRYNDEQRSALEKWFWRTCFSRRYSGATSRNINRDVEEIMKLKRSEPSNLTSITTSITRDFFTSTQFTMNTVNTKTFILMLAQTDPKSFISGAVISLRNVLKEYNRNEFHHIYPKAYLGNGQLPYMNSCLANFCFMSRADNQQLGGVAPSVYRQHMVGDLNERLERAFIVEGDLFSDDYKRFIESRAEWLLRKAGHLVN